MKYDLEINNFSRLKKKLNLLDNKVSLAKMIWKLR
jgi:hypothetical protein